MTKIFSTPKEVLTRVEAIPPADMEKIQKLLDSYIGKELELPSKLASATVIRELERSGWVVRDTGYSVYKVHPKKWSYCIISSYRALPFQIFGVLTGLAFLSIFSVSMWVHDIASMVVFGALFVVSYAVCLFGVWKNV